MPGRCARARGLRAAGVPCLLSRPGGRPRATASRSPEAGDEREGLELGTGGRGKRGELYLGTGEEMRRRRVDAAGTARSKRVASEERAAESGGKCEPTGPEEET